MRVRENDDDADENDDDSRERREEGGTAHQPGACVWMCVGAHGRDSHFCARLS